VVNSVLQRRNYNSAQSCMSTTFLNYFMYLPREGSRREQLIEIVNKSGSITVERLVKKHGMMGFSDTWNITIELRKLAKLGSIKYEGDVFFPAHRDKPAIISDDNLVPSREPVPFKPLKTFPPTISPRGQVIERRSFKTCKSNVRYQSKNDI
jgi:hypothetical protein